MSRSFWPYCCVPASPSSHNPSEATSRASSPILREPRLRARISLLSAATQMRRPRLPPHQAANTMFPICHPVSIASR